jgi:hypothetical protein
VGNSVAFRGSRDAAVGEGGRLGGKSELSHCSLTRATFGRMEGQYNKVENF